MKISKTLFTFILIIFVATIVLIGRFAYSIGQHNASLTVKEATIAVVRKLLYRVYAVWKRQIPYVA